MSPSTRIVILSAIAAALPSLVSAQNTQDCADLVTALNACPAATTNSFANSVTAMEGCLCTAAIATSYQACLTSSQVTNPALTGVPIDGLNFGSAASLSSICTLFASDVASANGAAITDSEEALTAFTTTVNSHVQPPAGASVAANGGGVGLTNTDYLGAQVVLAAATNNLGLTLQGILGYPTTVTVAASTTSTTSTTSTSASTDAGASTTLSSSATTPTFATATDATALPGQPAQTKSQNVFTGEAKKLSVNAREGKAVAGMLMAAVVGAAWLL